MKKEMKHENYYFSSIKIHGPTKGRCVIKILIVGIGGKQNELITVLMPRHSLSKVSQTLDKPAHSLES